MKQALPFPGRQPRPQLSTECRAIPLASDLARIPPAERLARDQQIRQIDAKRGRALIFRGLDHICPPLRFTISGMKMEFFPPYKDEGEVVASWGQAQLIKYLDGKLELRGGSDEDRAAAEEWMSLFWREASMRD